MPKYAAKYIAPGQPTPSGWIKFGNIAVDVYNLVLPSDYPFTPGINDLYDTNGYIIISDTTNANLVGRKTGNSTGVAEADKPTYWASASKTEESFLYLVNRLPSRSGQTPFTDTVDAKTWLNSNGYWTSYIPPVVTNSLVLRLDTSDPLSYPGTGDSWYDLVDPPQNITLIGDPVWTAEKPSYFTFNGSDQRGLGIENNVIPQTEYTKSAWFYLNDYADNNIISSDIGGHFMYFANTDRLYSGHSNWGDYSVYPSNAIFDLDTWYYVALTFNTIDGMKLYINGVLDSTYTADRSPHGGDGSVNIASFGNSNLLNGRISKVYCYSKALTDTEVLQNYNADKSNFGY